MRQIVHMVKAAFAIPGPDVRTLCGEVANPFEKIAGPDRYKLLCVSGSVLDATTKSKLVSCKKCLNLLTIGTIHVPRPSRSSSSQKRAVVPAAGTSRRRGGPTPARSPARHA